MDLPVAAIQRGRLPVTLQGFGRLIQRRVNFTHPEYGLRILWLLKPRNSVAFERLVVLSLRGQSIAQLVPALRQAGMNPYGRAQVRFRLRPLADGTKKSAQLKIGQIVM